MTPQQLEHEYQPRGACRELFYAKDPEVLLSGPAGTGKSRACLEKLLLQAMRYPGMRGLICRKTQTSLGSTTLVTWRERVAAEAIAAGICRFHGGSPERASQYRFENGSTLTIGGMDKATKIMSSEYDVAYVGEAIELTIGDLEAITTRLRNGVMPYQQLIADTNPDADLHWLKRRCDAGTTRMLESRHTDNPVYFDAAGKVTAAGAAYLAKLDNLSGVRRSRLRDGLWVSAEGVIYEDWDPVVHLVDRFKIPTDWPRYWVVDFGIRNPFVCQWWARDPDGRLFMYREIYHTGRLVEDHARKILRQVTTGDHGVWIEPKPVRIICDHDAEGRATLERHLGLTTVAANKKVLEGIEAFASRLKPGPDGRPRLFYLRDSLVERDPFLVEAVKPTCTVEEIPGYVWDRGAGKAPKEAPLKENDHGCDCGRYLAADLDLGGVPNIRWLD